MVNILVFLLAFFLDFFELAFIIVPLLGPVAEKLGIDLIWFGVLLGVNMQTSFMHPPFGFALFYLRSVAPAKDYIDKVTGKLHRRRSPPGRSTGARCPSWSSRCIMVGLIIAFPHLVTGDAAKKASGRSVDQSNIEIPQSRAARRRQRRRRTRRAAKASAAPDFKQRRAAWQRKKPRRAGLFSGCRRYVFAAPPSRAALRCAASTIMKLS